MKTYRNILVGYDDSDYSKSALVEALHLARSKDSTVTMLHCVYHDSEEFSTSDSQLEGRLENGKKTCLGARDNYSKEFSTDIKCEVVRGEPHQAIPEMAADISADLIVMGTHGRKGLRRMLMGSVTAGVILASPCDVLVIKKPCDKCTGIYRYIVVPYDGSETAKKAIARGTEFSGPDTSVTLLYVIPRYEEIVGFIKTESIREKLLAEARKIVAEGEAIAAKSDINVSTMVEEGSPVTKIVEVAEGLRSDLIIMGSHGWSGVDKAIIGSTAERTILNSNTPVLVVR